MARPKAAAVAMTALTFPKRPSHGFDLTVSPIMHVSTLWNRNKFFTFFNLSQKNRNRKWKKKCVKQQQHIPKYGHQNESGTKIGNDSSRILFQFMIKCSWCKSSDCNVFKVSRLFILADCVQKFIFPCSTSVEICILMLLTPLMALLDRDYHLLSILSLCVCRNKIN
jgi:hypothetical protein